MLEIESISLLILNFKKNINSIYEIGHRPVCCLIPPLAFSTSELKKRLSRSSLKYAAAQVDHAVVAPAKCA